MEMFSKKMWLLLLSFIATMFQVELSAEPFIIKGNPATSHSKELNLTTKNSSSFYSSSASFEVGQPFSLPSSPRAMFNMNPDWKFIKQDVASADQPNFDDSKWTTISTPHTFNDMDSFDEIITRGGEKSEYMGIAWYRKHFKIPSIFAGSKVFVEFEGMKQAGRFFINGKPVGKFENGVTPCGIDISDFVNFGDKENILAVKIDNSGNYAEEATGVSYEWMSKDFNPNYGGINHNVWLHITGKVYQTLPLYENLKTSGVYVYANNISVPDKTADVTVESEVRNETGDSQSIDLSAVVVDASGIVRATFKGDTYDMVGGETRVLTASGAMKQVRLWDVNDPYLYDVYSILTIDGKIADVNKVKTGFRKTEFKGGAGKGGVYLNDRFVYLKGYSQRSTDEWAGLGQAYPNWMHDYTASCIRDSKANYMRWMHIMPQPANVNAFDKYGIIEIAPAGDKEKDVEGRQWEQRTEVMRDVIIYLRNHPSILFWEAGNNGISGDHMKQMHDLRVQWDPNGGRAMGCRSISDSLAVQYAEYFGIMIGQDERTEQLKGYSDIFRTFSAERRDKAPFLEAEDFRDEAARRFWDDFTPPHFGFKPKSEDTWKWNCETLCVAAVKRYNDYFINNISNNDPKHARWSGYSSIIFADSNSHGRQYGSEVCRVSGKMDAVRLPKPSYFVHRVMQNDKPDIYIIGHWTYPKATKKTMYVVSNCESVELFINGKSKGVVKAPTDGFLFAFPDVEFVPGEIKAIGMNKGKAACEYSLKTAGAPAKIKLTVHTGSKGLLADGSDVAFIDFEVLDAKGERCPDDEARVDFDVSGPAIWRGGYNSGIPGSTNNKYLNTECGINRVSVRSTLKPGVITIKASRPGLKPAIVTIESKSVQINDGLTNEMPQSF